MGDLHPWCARVTVCLLPGRDAGHRARPVLPSLPSSTRHLHRVWRPSLSHLRRPHAALPGNVHVRPGAGLPGRRLQVGPCLSWLAPGKQEKYPFYIKDWLTPHFVCTAFTWLTTTAAVKEFPGPRRWLCLSGMSLCSSSRTGLWRFVLCWVIRCRFQNDFFDTKCFRTSLNNNKKSKALICHFTCDSIQSFLHIDFVVSLSFAATSLAQMLRCALFHLSDVVPHFMLLWHDANKG